MMSYCLTSFITSATTYRRYLTEVRMRERRAERAVDMHRDPAVGADDCRLDLVLAVLAVLVVLLRGWAGDGDGNSRRERTPAGATRARLLRIEAPDEHHGAQEHGEAQADHLDDDGTTAEPRTRTHRLVGIRAQRSAAIRSRSEHAKLILEI